MCQIWLKLAQWFWRRRWKCEKFMTTITTTGRRRTADTFWSEKLTWVYGSGELKKIPKKNSYSDNKVIKLFFFTSEFFSFDFFSIFQQREITYTRFFKLNETTVINPEHYIQISRLNTVKCLLINVNLNSFCFQWHVHGALWVRYLVFKLKIQVAC